MKTKIEHVKLNEDLTPYDKKPERKYSSRAVRISNILFFIVGFIVGMMIK